MEVNVDKAILDLVAYALRTNLIEKEDITYSVNQLLIPLKLDSFNGDINSVPEIAESLDESKIEDGTLLEAILKELDDYAVANNLTDGESVVYRDLFDTKLMGILTPKPSQVIRKFNDIYKEDAVKATDFYYEMSRNTDYIRRYRISKDVKWVTPTEYGDLDITINLSKPEKDPKAIAAAKNAKQSGYPKCQLCMENEGYAGRVDHPAR